MFMLSTTKAHAIFMGKQHEIHADKQPLQLQRLSDTRWACRYGAVNTLCRTYDCLLATLEYIGDGHDCAPGEMFFISNLSCNF